MIYSVTQQYFSNAKMHPNHMGTLLKCGFEFMKSVWLKLSSKFVKIISVPHRINEKKRWLFEKMRLINP
jgi:hypothetical protein